MKLVQTASLSSPCFQPGPWPSIPWASSSTTKSLRLRAISLIAFMSALRPYRWTGTIAFVFGVMAASIFAGSMLAVLGSQSTNTAFARTIQIASAVAKNVLAVVMISSPGWMPRAMNTSQSASVPEFSPTACFIPK